jgi:hypothetical protein
MERREESIVPSPGLGDDWDINAQVGVGRNNTRPLSAAGRERACSHTPSTDGPVPQVGQPASADFLTIDTLFGESPFNAESCFDIIPRDGSQAATECRYDVETSDPDHLAPWSWILVCSDSGTEWVSNRTGNHDFTTAARNLRRDLGPGEAWKTYLSTDSQQPLQVNEAEAWDYTNGKLTTPLST